jgi:hypothetical protein
LVHLSTAVGSKYSDRTWVNIQSARWVNIQSARTGGVGSDGFQGGEWQGHDVVHVLRFASDRFDEVVVKFLNIAVLACWLAS